MKTSTILIITGVLLLIVIISYWYNSVEMKNVTTTNRNSISLRKSYCSKDGILTEKPSSGCPRGSVEF